MPRQSGLDSRARVVDVPIDLLEKVDRAVEKVHERMLRTAHALQAAGVPFAVIGGNAVAIWVRSVDEGATRNTKDVDILLSRADLDRAKFAMDRAGFDMDVVNGVTLFLDRDDPMPSRGVHVVFVGEKVRPHYRYPAPDISDLTRSVEDIPAIGLRELLVMKLQANRDLDRVHVRDLLGVGLITDAIAESLPNDLRERLEAIRANPDG
jgi:CO dehydrogenase/acetyl-CoA synthase delta subunit